MQFPKEYFVDRNNYQQGYSFKYTLNEELAEKMKELLVRKKYKVVDFLLSAFIDLLARISGKKQLTVQTIIGDGAQVYSISIILIESTILLF